MGLNPPFGMKARLANKFIDKALSFKPKLIILIVPKETQRLDQKQQPYDLIWEDTGSLSGRSFYLPGSFDVTDKLIDQWNVSPPPLYLWSHPDWTQKHRKIAEGRGHTTSKVVSHSKQMYCRLDDIHRQNHGEVPYERNDRYSDEKVTYMTDKVVSHSKQMDRHLDDIHRQNHGEVLYEQNDRCGDEKDTCMTDKVVSHSKQVDCRLDDIHRQNHGEVPYEQNDSCGDEKDTYMTDESVNFVVGKPERVFGLPPEKLVEVAYEETKAASGRGGTFQANQSGIHLEERAAHSDSRVDRYNDKKEEKEGSNCSRWRTELKRTGDAAKADSNMSISPSDSRNLQYKSRSDAPHMSNEYSSKKVAHQDNYISDPVEKVPYEDYIRNVAEYGVASVEKHLADILTGDYVGGPKSSFYTKASGESSGSFYSSQNLQENGVGPVPRNAVSGRNVGDVRMYGHIRDDHTQTATASAAIRAQVRTYGGRTGDGHPPTATNPPANYIRSQLRMYGRQRTHTSGYSDRQFVRTAPYGGISSLDSMGRSAMDWYTPRAHETNYTASQFNVPDNRRDMAPSPLGFGSRQQYPYRHPGSSGGWPG